MRPPTCISLSIVALALLGVVHTMPLQEQHVPSAIVLPQEHNALLTRSEKQTQQPMSAANTNCDQAAMAKTNAVANTSPTPSTQEKKAASGDGNDNDDDNDDDDDGDDKDDDDKDDDDDNDDDDDEDDKDDDNDDNDNDNDNDDEDDEDDDDDDDDDDDNNSNSKGLTHNLLSILKRRGVHVAEISRKESKNNEQHGAKMHGFTEQPTPY